MEALEFFDSDPSANKDTAEHMKPNPTHLSYMSFQSARFNTVGHALLLGDPVQNKAAQEKLATEGRSWSDLGTICNVNGSAH